MSICFLKETDITDRDKQWPVIFSFVDDNPSFVSRAQSYARGEGYYGDDVATVFWDELDEYEQTVNESFGVSSCFLEDSYDMSYQEFYSFFKVACNNYLEEHPGDAEVIEKALSDYREKFLK